MRGQSRLQSVLIHMGEPKVMSANSVGNVESKGRSACRQWITGLMIVGLVGGCSFFKKEVEGEFDFVATTWRAEEIDGQATAGIESTMEFRDQSQVSGQAGCNNYTGPVSLDGVSIKFGDLAATRKMCPQPQMDQEQRFFNALGQVRRLELKEERRMLLLYSQGRDPSLRLRRIDTP